MIRLEPGIAHSVMETAEQIAGPTAQKLLMASGIMPDTVRLLEHTASATAPVTVAQMSELSLSSRRVFDELKFAAGQDARLHPAYAMGTDAFAGPSNGRVTPWVVQGLDDVMQRLRQQTGIVPSASSFITRTEQIKLRSADILRQTGGEPIHIDDVRAAETDLLSYTHLKSVADDARAIAHSDEYRDMERVGFRNDPRYYGDADNHLGVAKLMDAANGRFTPDVLPILKNVNQGLFSREPNGLGQQLSRGISEAFANSTGFKQASEGVAERAFPFDKTLSGRVSRLHQDIGYILARNGGNPVDIAKFAPTAAFDDLAPAQRRAFAAWQHEIMDQAGPIASTEYIASGANKGLWQHMDAKGTKLVLGKGLQMHLTDDAGSVSLNLGGIRKTAADASASYSTVRPDGISIHQAGRLDPSSGFVSNEIALNSADGSVHVSIKPLAPTAEAGSTPHHSITIVNNATGAKEVIQTNRL